MGFLSERQNAHAPVSALKAEVLGRTRPIERLSIQQLQEIGIGLHTAFKYVP